MEPRAEDTDLDQRNGRDRVRGRDRRVDAQPLELSPLCARLHPSIVSKWTDSRVRPLIRLRHLLPRHRGRRALVGKCSRESSTEYPSRPSPGEKGARGEVLAGILNRAPFSPLRMGQGRSWGSAGDAPPIEWGSARENPQSSTLRPRVSGGEGAEGG